MPRKQNGFGTSQSFAFKGSGRIDRGKGAGAFGVYPSNRQYGTSVQRTVIEQWNLDSNWAKWRKGFEMFNWTAWSDLKVENPFYDPGLPQKNDEGITVNPEYVVADLQSLLYQGTTYELPTLFTGVKFPTQSSDVNAHYVARRIPEPKPLGTVNEVWNNDLVYKDQKANREIWVKGIPNIDNARLLLQMVGERLTDGDRTAPMRTEATVKNVLTGDGLPAIYKGVTAPKSIADSVPQELQPTRVTVRIPVSDIVIPDDNILLRANQGLSRVKREIKNRPTSVEQLFDDPNILNNAIIYIPNFFSEKLVTDLDAIIWGDAVDFFGATIQETETGVELFALDPGQEALPPSMYDINNLDSIITTTNASYTISGTYVFEKKAYQRFFKNTYVTADLVASEVEQLSYSVLPFPIKGAKIENIAGVDTLVIDSFAFQSEIKMYPPLTIDSTLVFTDFSFTKSYGTDTGKRDAGDNVIYKETMYTDVNPWMDEVFTSGENLRPAQIYTCSCPSHSQSILAMPQSSNGPDERKNNRQYRYPLPSVLGQTRFEGVGTTQAAGKISNWQSPDQRLGFRMCKHSIATMFIDGIKVIEPSQYPTVEERIKFEEKLNNTIRAAMEAFNISYKRQEIGITEIVFALAQGLNLDDVETAYVILNSD